MSNILATWICIDNADNASYFPSSKGSSNDAKIQEIYWRCLAACMYTARKFNPTLRLVVFSNSNKLPKINDVDFVDLFKKLEIEFYTTPFEYQTPMGYYNNWRNQFYEFSIFKYISSNQLFKDEDAFVLLDSDCIITGELSPLFKLVVEKKCISYIIDYRHDYKINGLTRVEMKSIFEKIQESNMENIPDYHAGEIYAATIETTKKLMSTFYPTWDVLINFHQADLPRLHEEAHVLSYLFFKIGCKGGEANKYIKRMWTDPTSYRNIQNGDEKYLIWHLPAEKRFGFKIYFLFLKKINFNLNLHDPEQSQVMFQKIFQVPAISFTNRIYYIIKKLVKVISLKLK